MDEKEPTQETQPVTGEPITTPVPTRDEIDDALAKAPQPLPQRKPKKPRKLRHKRN